MAGKVTALEPQKRSRDRVNIYLDGEFAFGLAWDVAVNLHIGAWLSDDDIAALKANDARERVHQRALNFLTHRPRSEAELRRYLLNKEVAEAVVDVEVERLRRVGLLDDVAFAHFWIDNRARFRPRGKRMLAYELRQKGVSSSVIDEALADYDERAAIEKEARRQVRRLAQLPPDLFRRRLHDRLARRGFTYDLIRDVLNSYPSSRFNTEESEED